MPVRSSVVLLGVLFALSAAAAPRSFEANGGQLPPDVRYAWRAPGMAVHLRDAAFAVVLDAGRSVGFRFAGGNAHAAVAPLEPRTERRNFFLGGTSTTGVATFGRVRYRSIWPGIDAVFHGTSGSPELDFVIAPDADPAQIALRIDGADRVALDGDGSLLVTVARRALVLRTPVAYQESGEGRVPVGVRYVLRERQVRLRVDAYDRTRPLIVDPVLDWATYFGGSFPDSIQAVTTDAAGNVYVAGSAQSPDLPMGSGFAAITDGFVSKLTPAGDAVLFTTYLGGRSADAISDIVLDGSGIYVTGSTQSVNFPVTPGAFDEDFNDPDLSDRLTNDDMFVAKLALDGSQLLYSTYLGGTSSDGIGQAIAVHDGFAYVAGRTTSPDFPTTDGAFDTSFNGADDVFVTKLDVDGSALVQSTFLGGQSREFVFAGGLAVRPDGSVFLAGATQSFDFPRTAGSPPVSRDLFVAQFDPQGALSYCIPFGGSDNEGGNHTVIALDAGGGVLIGGETTSADWPVVGPSPAFAGGSDLVLARLDPSTSAFTFSRYLGGAGDEAMRRGALGDDGFFYLTGETKSPDFPLTAGALDPVILGSDPEDPNDGFLVRVHAATGAIDYASFLGGGEFDTGVALAYAAGGIVHVAAHTVSTDLPVTPGSLESTPKHSYLARFSFGATGDGVAGASGGTVTDGAGTGAAFSVGAGVLATDVAVDIEVLPDPGATPPAGFSASGTSFVRFVLTPNPSPIASPGATITLPLETPLAEGTVLDLFRYDPDAGSFSDTGIDGSVDAGGATATFAGVTHFSVFVGLRAAYGFGGFQPPLANDGSSVFASGRTVPVKFRLTFADGSPVTAAVATLRVFALPDGGEVAPDAMRLFRFDPAAGTYIYNLKLTGYPSGAYRLRVEVSDGSTHEVTFSVR